jgi:quercetin dioxygenase-like cupin family protein
MNQKARSALFATGVAICAAASIFIRSSVASEPDAMMNPDFNPALHYMRLYTDPEGVSHFSHEAYELRSGNDKGQGILAAFPIENVQGATYVALRNGQGGDQWHTAPRRQYIICLTGEAEFTAGSGEVRRLKPGGVILVEDTTGQGHITRSVGDGDHIAIVVPAPAD